MKGSIWWYLFLAFFAWGVIMGIRTGAFAHAAQNWAHGG